MVGINGVELPDSTRDADHLAVFGRADKFDNDDDRCR